MSSRQVFALATTNTSARLNDYDSLDLCRNINLESYQLALSIVSKRALERFNKFGQHLVMIPDSAVFFSIGPLFIRKRLSFIEAVDNNRSVMRVQSVSLRTPFKLDWLTEKIAPPDSAGYHYCKVLSPARAVEWIYTDGLRKYMSLSSGIGQK